MGYAKRTCEICATTYRPTYGQQRTCSRKCGGRLNRHEQTGRWPASPIVYSNCSICGALLAGRSAKQRCEGCPPASRYVPRTGVVRTTACVHCGIPIQEVAKIGRPRSSCDECTADLIKVYRKNAKHRRRAQTRVGELIRADEIYARDRHRCGLCGKRLAMTKVAPHPKAPTLDHVVPLSEGGEHARANVQAAHFLCNSLKGAKGGAQQLALIG